MRDSAMLCSLCVVPDALNFAPRERAPPPANVKGAVADRDRHCTKCGGLIPKGVGFVYVCGQRPVAGEHALHERLCGRSDS